MSFKSRDLMIDVLPTAGSNPLANCPECSATHPTGGFALCGQVTSTGDFDCAQATATGGFALCAQATATGDLDCAQATATGGFALCAQATATGDLDCAQGTATGGFAFAPRTEMNLGLLQRQLRAALSAEARA